MIFQNVPEVLFEALKNSGCIMYMHNDNIESVSMDRILAVYNDVIIVYNYDRLLRVNFTSTNMILFKIQQIDAYYHIFTIPAPIPDEVIAKVLNHDLSALKYAPDIVCEAISMAVRALLMPPFKYTLPMLFSSFTELSESLKETIENKIDKGEDVGLLSPFPNNTGIDPYYIEEQVISHTIPIEEIQATFDPWELTDRGRQKVGIAPDDQTFMEKMIQDDEINIACTEDDCRQMKKSGEQFRFAGTPVKIGANCYRPVLVKVVDVDENVIPVEQRDPRLQQQIKLPSNPIGYIDDKK